MAITVQQFDFIAERLGLSRALAAAEQAGGVIGSRTPVPAPASVPAPDATEMFAFGGDPNTLVSGDWLARQRALQAAGQPTETPPGYTPTVAAAPTDEKFQDRRDQGIADMLANIKADEERQRLMTSTAPGDTSPAAGQPQTTAPGNDDQRISSWLTDLIGGRTSLNIIGAPPITTEALIQSLSGYLGRVLSITEFNNNVLPSIPQALQPQAGAITTPDTMTIAEEARRAAIDRDAGGGVDVLGSTTGAPADTGFNVFDTGAPADTGPPDEEFHKRRDQGVADMLANIKADEERQRLMAATDPVETDELSEEEQQQLAAEYRDRFVGQDPESMFLRVGGDIYGRGTPLQRAFGERLKSRFQRYSPITQFGMQQYGSDPEIETRASLESRLRQFAQAPRASGISLGNQLARIIATAEPDQFTGAFGPQRYTEDMPFGVLKKALDVGLVPSLQRMSPYVRSGMARVMEDKFRQMYADDPTRFRGPRDVFKELQTRNLLPTWQPDTGQTMGDPWG